MSEEGLNNTYYASFVGIPPTTILMSTANTWALIKAEVSITNNLSTEPYLIGGMGIFDAYSSHDLGAKTKIHAIGPLFGLADGEFISIFGTTNYNSTGNTLYKISEYDLHAHTIVIDLPWNGFDDGTGTFYRSISVINTHGSESGDFLVLVKFWGYSFLDQEYEVAISVDGVINPLKQAKTYAAGPVGGETFLTGIVPGVSRGQKIGLWIRNPVSGGGLTQSGVSFFVQRVKSYDI